MAETQPLLTICTTCRIPERRGDAAEGDPCGEAFLAAVVAAAEGQPVAVRGTACLMGCEHGCNAALTCDGKLSYVLGRFTPDAEAADALVAYAVGYGESATGQVPYRAWPQGVKGHFIARIPPAAPEPEAPPAPPDLG